MRSRGHYLRVKHFIEGVLVLTMHHAKPLTHQPIITKIRPFVGTTFHQHITQLVLTSIRDS